MEPRPPRRKKNSKGHPEEPFPVINKANGKIRIFTGAFNGFSVVIEKQGDMEKINSMGCFGKATLSRSIPSYNTRESIIMRKRQFDAQDSLVRQFPRSVPKQETTVIVVENSDSDNEDYFNNIKPVKTNLKIPFKETLNLTLEEAYFLVDEKKCLQILKNGNCLSIKATFSLFCETQRNFIQNYVVYHYFRTRNWVVKSGLKFGGDYLLYKDGPSFYHASFLVIIDVIRSMTQERVTQVCKRSMDWTSLICLNRLTETAAKELLIAQVTWPQKLSYETARSSCKNLKQFNVTPILMRRWVPNIERKDYVGLFKKSAKSKDKNNKKKIKIRQDDINQATSWSDIKSMENNMNDEENMEWVTDKMKQQPKLEKEEKTQISSWAELKNKENSMAEKNYMTECDIKLENNLTSWETNTKLENMVDIIEESDIKLITEEKCTQNEQKRKPTFETETSNKRLKM